jgi:hypothetical protein
MKGEGILCNRTPHVPQRETGAPEGTPVRRNIMIRNNLRGSKDMGLRGVEPLTSRLSVRSHEPRTGKKSKPSPRSNLNASSRANKKTSDSFVCAHPSRTPRKSDTGGPAISVKDYPPELDNPGESGWCERTTIVDRVGVPMEVKLTRELPQDGSPGDLYLGLYRPGFGDTSISTVVTIEEVDDVIAALTALRAVVALEVPA